MARIIPGVEVTVVKEVVPQQLAPTGVLGLVAVVESAAAPGEAAPSIAHASSWSRFVERFGRGSLYSAPEARQALENGAFELVVTPIAPDAVDPATATIGLGTNGALTLTARAGGTWANGKPAFVTLRKNGDAIEGFDLAIERTGPSDREEHKNLTVLPGSPRWVGSVVSANSWLVQASTSVATPVPLADVAIDATTGVVLLRWGTAAADAIVTLKAASATVTGYTISQSVAAGVVTLTLKKGSAVVDGFPLSGDGFPGEALQKALRDVSGITAEIGGWPAAGKVNLTGGEDAAASDYAAALDRLVDEGDVDMVLASLPPTTSADLRKQVYADVTSHCNRMSRDCKGRVGFGEIKAGQKLGEAVSMTSSLVSDRFVMVAPQGVVGAVAGMVGALRYFESPTFKAISVGGLSPLGTEDQQELLKGYVVPVVTERGRGTIVIRGLTTDGDQLSVRRVADHAVRGVKMIGDKFIGRLNNADGRTALKQKLTEFLLQMAKEGALVPSTDGKDPAFKVDVYSSQADFALGIVRVDVAVRPVRAIDFIYATILVQV
jgi:hypothetical protein